jgi:hypothetical protein
MGEWREEWKWGTEFCFGYEKSEILLGIQEEMSGVGQSTISMQGWAGCEFRSHQCIENLFNRTAV